ncbi:hypothetical protein QCN29_19225 [Streptomyces sp. HNM0663]|uniref:Secreted protein n=1 Tax=Streptomyces chengmaiensis TaxID=3040919 RepID=A0ABT6HQ77_9ACTN|nr:hypothetical protein [Streptomyces chengmaiensis]MDH2390883.1 hypothetical protein [Streptomyces chengmaiensis]
MLGRAVVRRLALLSLCVVALGHGFAGAVTHLPHHPAHVPVTTAGAYSAPEAGGEEDRHDGHAGPACEIVTGSAPGSCHPAAGVPVSPLDMELSAVLSPGGFVPSRSPPKPSPVVLSVLRI